MAFDEDGDYYDESYINARPLPEGYEEARAKYSGGMVPPDYSPRADPGERFIPSTMEGSTGDVPLPPRFMDQFGGSRTAMPPVFSMDRPDINLAERAQQAAQQPKLMPIQQQLISENKKYEDLPSYRSDVLRRAYQLAQAQGIDVSSPQGQNWLSKTTKAAEESAGTYVHTPMKDRYEATKYGILDHTTGQIKPFNTPSELRDLLHGHKMNSIEQQAAADEAGIKPPTAPDYMPTVQSEIKSPPVAAAPSNGEEAGIDPEVVRMGKDTKFRRAVFDAANNPDDPYHSQGATLKQLYEESSKKNQSDLEASDKGSTSVDVIDAKTGKQKNIKLKPGDELPDGVYPAKAPPEGSMKDAQYAVAGRLSHEVLSGFENNISSGKFDPTKVTQAFRKGMTGTVLNKYLSSEEKQYYSAVQEFINSIARRQSGATIQPSEYDKYSQYLVTGVGDDPKSIQFKQSSRSQNLEPIELSASPAFDYRRQRGLAEGKSHGIDSSTMNVLKELSGGDVKKAKEIAKKMGLIYK